MITSIQDDTLLSEMTAFSGVTGAEGDFILGGFFFFLLLLFLRSKRTAGLKPCLVTVPTVITGEKI